MKSDFRKYLVLALSILPVNVLLAQCEVDAGQNLTICQGESVEIGGDPTVVDAGNNYTISWSNGAGNEENPTVTPNSTTTYTVTLTDGNCVDTDQITVTVLPSPDAGFTFGPNAACAGAPVTFTNATLGCVACEYSWDFDNPESGAANTSTANNPQHVFVAVGDGTVVFNVSLTATSSNGCSNTQVVQVSVQESPEAVLTEDANFIQCLGIGSFEVYVYDDSDPAQNAEYEIVWGDGSPGWSSDEAPDMLTHTYVGLDIFELTYTVTGANGCQDVATYDVTNISNPAIGAANPGNTLQCGPVEFCFPLSNYDNNHPSTVYIVNYGDGSPLVTFAHPPPVEVCHTYSESSCGEVPAFFTFSIEAENNCPTSSVATISPIQIHTPPQAGFQPSPEPACVNSAVTFINTTIPGFNLNCNANTSETWDFGDGTPPFTVTNGGNQVHTYTAPGTYTVTLTTTNAGNQALACGSTTFSMDICIETPPTPQFSVSEDFGCMPLATAISNTSDNGISCDLLRTWEIDYFPSSCDPSNGSYSFINGTSAASDEPEIQFNSVGVYNIVLEMENSCGLFTQTIPVEVITLPEVTINPVPDICEGESVSPSAVIDDCGGTITAYNWQMAGASPSSSVNLSPGSITYANDGNFTITLGVTNECGTGNDSESLIVESAPVLNFNAQPSQEICAGSTVTITVNGAVSYVWTPAPGLLSAIGGTATVQPSVSTTYTVTGYSAAGCPTVLAIPVTVNPLPQVSAANNFEICSGENVVIGATISGGTMPVVTYAWSPAAGLNNTAIANPTASPANTTNYTLTVTDSEGCVGSGIIPVTVNPLPLVNAGPDIQLCNQPVAELLSGYSPQIGGTGVWSGTGITDPDAGEFTPPGLGTYVLTYTFTDLNGCVESDDLEVEVIDPSEALAGNDTTVCAGSPAIQLAQGGTWSGVGVTPGGLFNPNSPGLYTLTYSIGGGSCLTSDQLEITVLELPQLTMDPPVELCAGDSVQLGVSVSGGNLPIVSFSWSPGPGLSESDIADPWAAPAISMQYLLTVTDSEGCSSQASQMVTVNPNPPVNAGNNLVLCDQPVPEVLMGYSPAGGEWSGPNVSNNGVFTPDGTGLFTLYYSYTDASGCTAVDSITVEVADPTPANAGPDFDICLNASPVQLVQPGTWTGINVSPGGLFTPSQAGTFTLLLTTGVGTCQTSDETEVVIHELPVADAGPHETICIGENVQLNASAVSPNLPVTLYSWSGGAGLSSYNIANPIASPLVTTTYNLTVVDSEGCSDNDQVTVFVNPLPVITAGSDIVLCDQPIEEVLGGFTPEGPGDTGVWSGAGITDPDGIFLSPGTGTYVLTYTFTDENGCVSADQIEVEVVSPQVADAGDDIALCPNEGPYALSGYSPGSGGTWSGIGITDAGAGIFDPEISGSGVFELLYEYGSGTCYTFDMVEVTVYDLPILNAGNDEEVCGNEPIFELSGFDPPLGTWEGTGILNGADGSFDPGIGAGTYQLIYWYMDPLTGCADTVEKVVTVHPVPVASFTVPLQDCTNAASGLVNTSTGANAYEWDMGNGVELNVASPQYTYPDPGQYTIGLVALNNFGCSDTTSGTTEINDPPLAELELSTYEGCAPLEVTFVNNSYGEYLSFDWDLDISSSQLEVPDALVYPQGDDIVVYDISLEAVNYCGTSLALSTVTVYPQPVAGFGTNLDVFCSPFTVEFNNISVGNPDEYDWDFGDGTGSTWEEPGTHIYFTDSLPSDYTITLIATNECGIDTFDYTITVLPNTVTSFFNTDITGGCAPLQVEFTDFSEGGTIITYDFGNNDITDEPNPVHVFDEPGPYTVYQYVNNGCSFDTSFIFINVLPGPDLDFEIGAEDVCENVAVQFQNLSQNVSDVSWDFGDGSTSEEANPLHAYAQGGTYTVTLFGTSSLNECPGQVQQSFTVFNAPAAQFESGEEFGCSPLSVNFDNNTFGANFYVWDFGDGNTSADANPQHTFVNQSGEPIIFEVVLIAQNLQLCADTFAVDVLVNPMPSALFTLDQSESCENPVTVDIENLSTGAIDYEWDLSSGGQSDLVEPVLELSGVGTHVISLLVSNSYGCEDSHQETFTIHPIPEASFSVNPESGCMPLLAAFTNTSSLEFDSFWTFGDGAVSGATSPGHIYLNPGLYDVSLTVTSQFGCVDDTLVTDAIEVFSLPVANFSFSPEVTNIYNPEFQFTDLSEDPVLWFWSFGDGGVSFEQHPLHVYGASGAYLVELLVLNDNGCESRHTETVVIDEDFSFYVPNAFTPDGDGLNDVFLPVLVGGPVEFFEFKIFDRWGEKIFETNQQDEPWVGNYKGGDYYVKDDVYVWQAKIRLSGGQESKYFYGHVTMLR